MSPRLKIASVVLWAAVAVVSGVILYTQVIGPRFDQGIADTLGQGDYALTTTDGETFTAETLRGAPSAVFFGFTHCPDVCPTTLGDVQQWKAGLAEMGEDLRVFFVTVDPERDTPERLAEYLSWAPGVTGVTGSPEAVEEAVKAFRIYARKVPLDEGGYTMDHSAMVLLFDDRGRLFEPIGYGEGYERAMEKLGRLFGT